MGFLILKSKTFSFFFLFFCNLTRWQFCKTYSPCNSFPRPPNKLTLKFTTVGRVTELQCYKLNWMLKKCSETSQKTPSAALSSQKFSGQYVRTGALFPMWECHLLRFLLRSKSSAVLSFFSDFSGGFSVFAQKQNLAPPTCTGWYYIRSDSWEFCSFTFGLWSSVRC